MDKTVTRYIVSDSETQKIWDSKAKRFVRDGGSSYKSEKAARKAASRAINLCMNIGPVVIETYEV
jgi:hypothetical protein